MSPRNAAAVYNVR